MTQNEILEALTGMKRLLTHMTEYPKDKPYNERWDRELQYQVLDTLYSCFPLLSNELRFTNTDVNKQLKALKDFLHYTRKDITLIGITEGWPHDTH